MTLPIEQAKGLFETEDRTYHDKALPDQIHSHICAWVAELVDARDLKSLGAKSSYEFKSRPGHHKTNGLALIIANPFVFHCTTSG